MATREQVVRAAAERIEFLLRRADGETKAERTNTVARWLGWPSRRVRGVIYEEQALRIHEWFELSAVVERIERREAERARLIAEARRLVDRPPSDRRGGRG